VPPLTCWKFRAVASHPASADPALAANWQERLVGVDGLRIGLVSASRQELNFPAEAAVARRKSMALKALAPLGEGVSFVSLQKDGPAAQAATPHMV
jgi:hypothetical protein